MKFMLPSPSYPIIYLIVKFSQINLTFIMLKNYFIFIEPFINNPSTISQLSNILVTH
jgi:hypothetical protein